MNPQRPKGPSIGCLIFSLFAVVPIAELSILVWLAFATSFWFTLAVVITTAMLGATMLRMQGLGVWLAANREIAAGRFPADQLLDGIILMLGGALLLTPGLLTDIGGLIALLPPTRALVRGFLKAWLKASIAAGTIRVATFGGGFPGAPPTGAHPPMDTNGEAGASRPADYWPGERPTPFDRK